MSNYFMYGEIVNKGTRVVQGTYCGTFLSNSDNAFCQAYKTLTDIVRNKGGTVDEYEYLVKTLNPI